MNKPPEKLRVVCESNGKVWSWNSNDSLSDLDKHAVGERPFSEHFYTLEKSMTQKTENLTEKEAWIAMANGECVKALRKDYRVYKGELLEWSITLGTWMGVTTMGVGPYSIVPDPSKPKEVKEIGNDYTKSREKIILQEACHDDIANMILHHMDRFFVRKP